MRSYRNKVWGRNVKYGVRTPSGMHYGKAGRKARRNLYRKRGQYKNR